MTTFFDWLTVALFAGLITHFLANSVRPEAEDIPFGHYLLLSAVCAVANWLGNHSLELPAIALLLCGGAYAYRYLRPQPTSSGH